MSRRNLITESAALTFGLFGLVLLTQTPPFSHIFYPVNSYLLPLVWIAAPWAVIKYKGESLRHFGIHLDNLSRGAMTGIGASCLLLIPYFIAFTLLAQTGPAPSAAPAGVGPWLKLGVYQLFYIAIPEEFFFRGYLQTRLNQILGKPYSFLGASFGWGLVLTALLFTCFHFAFGLNFWNVGILVPALIFGWLREKTGSITAPTIFHALSNIGLFTLQGSY